MSDQVSITRGSGGYYYLYLNGHLFAYCYTLWGARRLARRKLKELKAIAEEDLVEVIKDE